MPRTIKILSVIMLLVALSPGTAEARLHHTKHHKVHHSGGMVDSSASYSDIVIDAETGRILHATNPDSLRHPASLTKMMTLYLTFQALESGRLNLNQSFPVSSNAAEQSPSKLGLRPGTRIRVEDAILGLVTLSANDAAVVLAEGLGGSEEAFGEMMTKQAHALGMSNSHFENPSGLPNPDQITTARDMAVLGHALIYHFPQFYPYFSHDSFTYAGIYHHNHNHLMDRYDGMDGIKTGYIRASGFNLVASAKRNGTRLIGVVFGGHSAVARDNQMAVLLDQAFDSLENGNAPATTAAPRLVSMKAAPQIAQGDGNDNDDNDDADVQLPAKAAPRVPKPIVEIKPTVVPPVAPAPVQVVAPKQKPMVLALAKPNVTPPPAPQEPVVITANNWGIQIGAYGDPEVGRQALDNVAGNLPQYLSNADPVIQKVSSGTVTMFRARLMSLDQKSAQAACTYLNKHGQSCMLVNP
jgi:D-alanyl-D-alanine carboxypeptidase